MVAKEGKLIIFKGLPYTIIGKNRSKLKVTLGKMDSFFHAKVIIIQLIRVNAALKMC